MKTIKAITKITNNSLNIVLMKKEPVKINGKPISKCSHEEILEEAKKYVETKGKNIQELRNEIVKGMKVAAGGQTKTKGVKVVKKTELQTGEEKMKKQIEGEKKTEGKGSSMSQEEIRSMKAPFRTKVYLLHLQHSMESKEAAIFLGRADRLRSARKAVLTYLENQKLHNKALKLTGK